MKYGKISWNFSLSKKSEFLKTRFFKLEISRRFPGGLPEPRRAIGAQVCTKKRIPGALLVALKISENFQKIPELKNSNLEFFRKFWKISEFFWNFIFGGNTTPSRLWNRPIFKIWRAGPPVQVSFVPFAGILKIFRKISVFRHFHLAPIARGFSAFVTDQNFGGGWLD